MKQPQVSNKEFKIESGIPIPEKHARKSGVTVTLQRMRKGDSVLIERKQINSFRTSASVNKVKIATRVENDTHIRIWRTN